MSKLRNLTEPEQVTDDVLALVTECVTDRFADRPLATEDFLDCLCDRYGNAAGWDVENTMTLAVSKIMRHARRVKRELA